MVAEARLARIEHTEAHQSFDLLSTTLIGRSRRCDLRLRGDEVSGQHAEIRFERGHWTIRDLNSRNGTFVDGKAVAEDGQRLRPGAALGFGAPRAEWTVDSVAPPEACAIGPDGRVPSTAGVLVLEAGDDAVSIWHEGGSWWLEDSAGDRRALAEDHMVVGDIGFDLDLPRLHAPTVSARMPTMAEVTYRFTVPPSEEGIVLELLQAGRLLGSGKGGTELLYRLAEIWLADASLDDPDRGWVVADDAIRMMGYSGAQHLNVAIHRARHILVDAGVGRAQAIVERDRPTRSLRFGGRIIEIVRNR